MSTKSHITKVSDSYLELIHQFPLRPIRSERELAAAEALVEKLAVRGEADLDSGETDYLDALSTFVEQYNVRVRPLSRTKMSPLARLKYLLEESGMKPAGLQELLGCSQSLVSMILNGERELSKENIRALAAHFRMDAGYFL